MSRYGLARALAPHLHREPADVLAELTGVNAQPLESTPAEVKL